MRNEVRRCLEECEKLELLLLRQERRRDFKSEKERYPKGKERSYCNSPVFFEFISKITDKKWEQGGQKQQVRNTSKALG